MYYLIKKVQIDVTALTNDIFKFLVTRFKISPAIAKDMLTMTSLLSTWKAFISFQLSSCFRVYLYASTPATCLGRPKWSPACEANLLVPIWRPMTFCPSLSCSSVNSRLFSVASLGPSWGTGLPSAEHYRREKQISKAVQSPHKVK